MNPLLTTLEIIAALAERPSTAVELQALFPVGIATLKRHISEARDLGADIESVKVGKASTYFLRNGPQVAARLKRWIELEKSRDLTC